MNDLMLESLEIRNFRAFRHLQVERLGRVNLVVGKNNVGKLCFLEALMLYARRGYPLFIWKILKGRHESMRSKGRRFHSDLDGSEERGAEIRYLFHGRKDIRGKIDPVQIGQIGDKNSTLSLTIRWYVTREDNEGNETLTAIKPEQHATVENPVPRIVIKFGAQEGTRYALNPEFSSTVTLGRLKYKELHCISIPSSGLDAEDVGGFWDRIALSSLQEDVVSALRIIAPNVGGVNLIGSRENEGERIVIVKVDGLDSPVPLGSMGDGMSRLFGVALALVNAKGGLLLIDEVDTGIHYSVLPDLWRLIFRVAHLLNVQVFATSHSWDCIQAFQEAADENTQEEGMLIRLEDKNGDVAPVLFDERKLGIATREHIEVR